MALSPPVINYYIPTTFESEVAKYSSRDGNYVMDFRNVDNIPDSILKNTADFILGSMPMSRVDNPYEGDYLEVDNAFRTTLPYTSKSNTEVILVEHPARKGFYHLYQTIYSDLVIESENPPAGVVKVNVALISSNHIRPDGSFSTALQESVDKYKRENGYSFSKKLTPKEFFQGLGDETSLNGVVTEYDTSTNTFKSYVVSDVIPGVTIPGPNKWISIYSKSSSFTLPYTSILPSDKSSLASFISAMSSYSIDVRYYKQDPVTGLYIYNTKNVVIANGKLTSRLPSSAMDSSVMSYNLNSSANFIFDSDLETHLGNRKIHTGVAFGRKPLTTAPDVEKPTDMFVSFPGAAVQNAGITLLAVEGVVNGSEKLFSEPKHIFTLVGDLVERKRKFLPDIRVKWETDYYRSITKSFKIKWQASYDPVIVRFRTSWTKNVELQRISKNLTLKWDKENFRVKKDSYNFRSSIALPEDELKKQFYAFNWTMEDTNVSKLSYKLSWEHELSRVNTLKYYSEWEKVLGNSCIVKCYYISLYKENNTFVDAISYQVYADPKIVDKDTLSFYFSNPYKFSIIRFNSSREPYNDTFLSEHSDKDLLSNRDDVPEHFVLVGNYTIEGIDIRGSLSLDVVSGLQQLNEYKSYWIPYNLDEYQDKMITLNDSKSKALPLNDKFKDDYNRDTVELDLVILTGTQCCFTQKATGSRCSPL